MNLNEFPTATVHTSNVPWEQFWTHWSGWKKPHGDEVECRLVMPFEYVVEKFGDYWVEFVARESEDDGTGMPEGIFLSLKELAYPSLETMLAFHSELFSDLILESLQAEFAGYVLDAPKTLGCNERSYFLQGINSLEVGNGVVILVGSCYLFFRR
jgi:hypothetical protein